MNVRKMSLNACLNVLRQIITVLFPIVTIPYAIRTIGVDNLGKVSYGHSIIEYFSLLAMLGVSQYAVREGAKRRDNRESFNTFLSEILTLNIFTTLGSYILLLLCITLIPNLRQYAWLLALQSLAIGLTTIGVDWINTVYEDFFLITVRSIITYFFTIALLFFFVRTPEDYYRYASLPVITTGIVCVSNLVYCRKYANIKVTSHPHIKKHIKPVLVFFANAIAVSIYVNIDITMLGWIKGDYDVGLYSLAVKIYVAVKHLLTAVYNVSISRLSYLWGCEKKTEFNHLLTKLFGYITFFLVPATVGLIIVSNDILVLLGGEEYLQTVKTLQVLSFALLFVIYGGLICDCLNVSIGREKDNLLATIIAALLNFLLNLIFIPKLSYFGASITTLISEAFVTCFCILRIPNIKSYFDWQLVLKTFIQSSLGSVLMVVLSFVVKNNVSPPLIRLIIIIPTSIVLYSLFMLIIRNVFALQITDLIVSKLKKLRIK